MRKSSGDIFIFWLRVIRVAEINIATDIIVGFPRETEVDFNKSGIIVNTSPSGSINTTKVILKATTNKDAICKYQSDNQWISMSVFATTSHKSSLITLTIPVLELRYSG